MTHAKALFFPGLCSDGDSATCTFSSKYLREQTAEFGKEQRQHREQSLATVLPGSCPWGAREWRL